MRRIRQSGLWLQRLPRRLRWGVGLLLLVLVGLLPFVVGSPATAEPTGAVSVEQPNTTPPPPTGSTTPTTLGTPNPQPGPCQPPMTCPPPGGTPAQAVDMSNAQVNTFCDSWVTVLDALPFDPTSWDRFTDPGSWNLFEWIPNLLKTAWRLIELDSGNTLVDLIDWFVAFTRDWEENWPEATDFDRFNRENEAPAWFMHAINEDNECTLLHKRPHRGCEAARNNWAATGRDYSDEAQVFPEACWGPINTSLGTRTFPSRNYDIGYNQGWVGPERWWRDFVGWLNNLFFDVAKGAMQFGLALIGWGFSFNFRQFNSTVMEIGDRYRANLVVRAGLDDLLWVVLVAWAGIASLMRRATVAAGEFAVSMVMLALALFFWGNREDYLNLVWDTMDQGSYAVIATARPDMPSECVNPCADDAKAAISRVQGDLHQMFVVEPYDYINWGHPLDGHCAEIRNQIVSVGPHEEDGWPRRHMMRNGCQEEAEFNRDPDNFRWMWSLVNAVVAVTVAIMLGFSGITLLFAKFMVAVMFILAPFALPFAIMPGAGRRIVFGWGAWVLQLVLAVLTISLIVSMLMLGIDVIVRGTAPISPVPRWILVFLFVMVILDRRKEWLEGTKSMATSLADSLTRMTPATSDFAGGSPVGTSFTAHEAMLRRGLAQGANAAVFGAVISASNIATGVSGAVTHRFMVGFNEKRLGGRFYQALHKAPPSAKAKPKKFKEPKTGFGWPWL